MATRRGWRWVGIHATAYVVAWALLALGIGGAVFLGSSRETTLASHDAVMRPDLSGYVVLDTGPVLPDVRIPSGERVGVSVRLGKTDAGSTEELLGRYALIGSQPAGAVARVREEFADLLRDSMLRGGALAVLPLLAWAALGPRRRRGLLGGARSWRGLSVGVLLVGVGVGVVQPWHDDDETLTGGLLWQSLAEFLGPAVPIPDQLHQVEVRGDVTTAQTRRLVESAVRTYQKGLDFYRRAALDAAALDVRQPEDGESVVLLVSDRHDNIGMDQVARAVGDAAGATAVFDLGDDTSTGGTWEAFSLDSLDASFDDGPYAEQRYAVTGNHDNGPFVGAYLADHGWTVLDDGDVVTGPDDVRLLGVGDPRSSGLGDWRDETGLSFAEVEERVADAACAADEVDERIGTVLVHDANLGRTALERGCVDLVLGGHLHVRGGPTAVVGTNARVGYTYTTGTTGGAAFAIAVGPSIRRSADIGLVTYRDGRPVGVQGVLLQTDGSFEVSPYAELALG